MSLQKTSVVELSIFRSVAGCLWYNDIKAGCMLIYVFTLLKVTHVSAYDDEDKTLQIVLLYV